MHKFLHTMVRYIPHNIDPETTLSETRAGTKGLKVRALWCKGEGEDDPCKKCKASANSQKLINKAVAWSSKLDGLKWYELNEDGAPMEEKDSFFGEIDERDYVEEGRGSEIGTFMSIQNIKELRIAVVVRAGLS